MERDAVSRQDVKHRLRFRWRTLLRFLQRYDRNANPSPGETNLEDFLTVEIMEAGIERNPVAQALQQSYETSLEAYYNHVLPRYTNVDQRKSIAVGEYQADRMRICGDRKGPSTAPDVPQPPKFPITIYHYLYFLVLYPELEHAKQVWFNDLTKDFPIAAEIDDWGRRNTQRWLRERECLKPQPLQEEYEASQLVAQGKLLGLDGCLPSLAATPCLRTRGRPRQPCQPSN